MAPSNTRRSSKLCDAGGVTVTLLVVLVISLIIAVPIITAEHNYDPETHRVVALAPKPKWTSLPKSNDTNVLDKYRITRAAVDVRYPREDRTSLKVVNYPSHCQQDGTQTSGAAASGGSRSYLSLGLLESVAAAAIVVVLVWDLFIVG
ncbi:hypothetical protein PG996_011048 [Apiospora saccharicola]|uniref:Uncharacterized protein n=1 Tax=Apiospora saccharicola TaxID=335842 RepID=A0ABR1UG76_9PEZI